MNIPEGRLVAEAARPVQEALKDYGHDFRGCIAIRQGEDVRAGEGFILVEDGNVLAAAFTTLGITLYQMNALDRMMGLAGPKLKVYAYGSAEKQRIIRDYPDAVIGELPMEMEAEEAGSTEPEQISYEALLATVVQLPGVAAAALVLDGLPIYQQGRDADFEHIAVATEDMVRSGTRIAAELQLGSVSQIILESPSNKVIIAPVSDMFLCVLAAHDANLGLIRLSIGNAQRNLEGR